MKLNKFLEEERITLVRKIEDERRVNRRNYLDSWKKEEEMSPLVERV